MINLLIAISVIAIFSFIFGILLGFAIFNFKIKDNPIIEKIDNILPQSQCGQCGYPGCYPYAEAIANNNETINKCIPGGNKVMLEIAELLNIEPQEINQDMLMVDRKVAFIDESNCIGCTKCIKICPVDAIIGTTRSVHTVVEDLCTGCNLCVPYCPTNCITMLPLIIGINKTRLNSNIILIKNSILSLNSKLIITFTMKD